MQRQCKLLWKALTQNVPAYPDVVVDSVCQVFIASATKQKRHFFHQNRFIVEKTNQKVSSGGIVITALGSYFGLLFEQAETLADNWRCL